MLTLPTHSFNFAFHHIWIQRESSSIRKWNIYLLDSDTVSQIDHVKFDIYEWMLPIYLIYICCSCNHSIAPYTWCVNYWTRTVIQLENKSLCWCTIYSVWLILSIPIINGVASFAEYQFSNIKASKNYLQLDNENPVFCRMLAEKYQSQNMFLSVEVARWILDEFLNYWTALVAMKLFTCWYV